MNLQWWKTLKTIYLNIEFHIKYLKLLFKILKILQWGYSA